VQLFHWNKKTEQFTPCVMLCFKMVGADVDMFYIWLWDNVRISESYKQRFDILKISLHCQVSKCEGLSLCLKNYT